MRDVVAGADGLNRCPWGAEPAEYVGYHDHEWGRPVVDDTRIFEKLCLEAFQSGLSWLTILRKRDAFRAAFAGFEIATVARFDERDEARLLADSGIVRNRAKVAATIANAGAALEVQRAEGSLAALVWRYEPAPPRARSQREIPASTPESKALAAELKRRGFRFLGPTTVYAAMQALGLVNDHLQGCWVHAEVDDERATLVRPS